MEKPVEELRVEDITGDSPSATNGINELELYEFDIPDDPMEQIKNGVTKITATESGVITMISFQSTCKRCIRVDFGGLASVEALKKYGRNILAHFLAHNFTLIIVLPFTPELHEINGASIFFRLPGIGQPEMIDYSAADDIEDDIDAEFEEEELLPIDQIPDFIGRK
jgi:hypothetical protein